jgi:invasion protein IalB
MPRLAAGALVALLLLGSLSASAQTPPAPAKPPAPATADPAQTTATYDDWVLRCVRTGDGKGPRACELVQTMVLQGQQQPVAQVALGYDKAELRLTLLVPPAVSFSRGPVLGVAAAATPHFDLAWRRCLPNGCFADVLVGPELAKILRSRSEPMQITFKDAGERDAALPFSLRGLVPALDALAKEPR